MRCVAERLRNVGHDAVTGGQLETFSPIFDKFEVENGVSLGHPGFGLGQK